MSTLHTVCENPMLYEIHRSKISLHCAKADYSYPTIRLLHTLSALAGLPTHIYQTVHQGALAFLVVVSSSNKSEEESPMKSENPTMTLRSPYLHGEDRAFESPRAHFAVGDFLYARRLRHNHHARCTWPVQPKLISKASGRSSFFTPVSRPHPKNRKKSDNSSFSIKLQVNIPSV
jgi:hypothetical protein